MVALCDIGMGVFLFLSGYGLEASYIRNGLTGFWDNKVRKIYMPALIVNCACLVEIWLIDGIRGIDRESALEGVFMISRYNEVNGPAWYINYLFLWYMIFWVINVLISKERIKCIAYVAAASVMWYLVPAVYPASNNYVISFVIGVFYADIVKNARDTHQTKRTNIFFTIAYLIVFVSVLFVYAYHWETIKECYPFRFQIMVGTVFVLFGIGFFYTIAEFIKKSMFGKYFIKLGTLSFGIYLCHWSLMMRTTDLIDASKLLSRCLVACIGFIMSCILAKGLNEIIRKSLKRISVNKA